MTCVCVCVSACSVLCDLTSVLLAISFASMDSSWLFYLRGGFKET